MAMTEIKNSDGTSTWLSSKETAEMNRMDAALTSSVWFLLIYLTSMFVVLAALTNYFPGAPGFRFDSFFMQYFYYVFEIPREFLHKIFSGTQVIMVVVIAISVIAFLRRIKIFKLMTISLFLIYIVPFLIWVTT